MALENIEGAIRDGLSVRVYHGIGRKNVDAQERFVTQIFDLSAYMQAVMKRIIAVKQPFDAARADAALQEELGVLREYHGSTANASLNNAEKFLEKTDLYVPRLQSREPTELDTALKNGDALWPRYHNGAFLIADETDRSVRAPRLYTGLSVYASTFT